MLSSSSNSVVPNDSVTTVPCAAPSPFLPRTSPELELRLRPSSASSFATPALGGGRTTGAVVRRWLCHRENSGATSWARCTAGTAEAEAAAAAAVAPPIEMARFGKEGGAATTRLCCAASRLPARWRTPSAAAPAPAPGPALAGLLRTALLWRRPLTAANRLARSATPATRADTSLVGGAARGGAIGGDTAPAMPAAMDAATASATARPLGSLSSLPPCANDGLLAAVGGGDPVPGESADSVRRST